MVIAVFAFVHGLDGCGPVPITKFRFSVAGVMQNTRTIHYHNKLVLQCPTLYSRLSTSLLARFAYRCNNLPKGNLERYFCRVALGSPIFALGRTSPAGSAKMAVSSSIRADQSGTPLRFRLCAALRRTNLRLLNARILKNRSCASAHRRRRARRYRLRRSASGEWSCPRSNRRKERQLPPADGSAGRPYQLRPPASGERGYTPIKQTNGPASSPC